MGEGAAALEGGAGWDGTALARPLAHPEIPLQSGTQLNLTVLVVKQIATLWIKLVSEVNYTPQKIRKKKHLVTTQCS